MHLPLDSLLLLLIVRTSGSPWGRGWGFFRGRPRMASMVCCLGGPGPMLVMGCPKGVARGALCWSSMSWSSEAPFGVGERDGGGEGETDSDTESGEWADEPLLHSESMSTLPEPRIQGAHRAGPVGGAYPNHSAQSKHLCFFPYPSPPPRRSRSHPLAEGASNRL